MIKHYQFLFLLLFMSLFNSVFALIDNRYLPLFRPQYDRTLEKPSSVGSNIFFMIATRAFPDDDMHFKKSKFKADNDIGIPELNGPYDLIKVTRALEVAGLRNPLQTEFQAKNELLFDVEGKIHVQGVWFGYEQNLLKHLYLGVSFFFMHITSRQRFNFTEELKNEINNFGKGTAIILRKQRREVNEILGLDAGQFSKSGPSDIDLYLRVGTIREYELRLRKLDVGITAGALFPSGPQIDIYNPASIPFGGNGHYGVYGEFDLTAELKEDWYVGFWTQLVGRFARNQIRRMPVLGVRTLDLRPLGDEENTVINQENVEVGEPFNYAPIVGKVRIQPGLTFGISPFAEIKDYEDFWGIKLRYTFIYHAEDNWKDLRSNKTIPVQLGPVEKFSSWAAEYFTVGITYDFDSPFCPRKFAPFVYLDWDIPVRIFAAHGVPKTNRVELGFEFNF